MTRFDNLSLQRKLLALTMITTVLALLLAAAALFAYDTFTVRQKLAADSGTLAETLRQNTIQALVFNDNQQASMILEGLSVQPNVVYAAVYDEDGELFAKFHREDLPLPEDASTLTLEGHGFHSGGLEVRRSMLFGGQQVGTFVLFSDLRQLRERSQGYLLILLAVLLGVSLFAFFFSARLQRVVSKPILELSSIARSVTEKRDYTMRAPQRQNDDEIARLVTGFNDMLAQIQQRDQDLIVARDRAEQANRTKSVFLANMSHELRTPLTAIIGYSEILEDDATEMGLKDFLPDLQKIKAAGKHLLGLINSILDLSKVEAGKMELYVERFSVANLVSEVASTVKPLVDKNRNQLTVRCADDVGEMEVDQTKTRQILFNLMSNASKFTEEGTVTIDVQRHQAHLLDGVLFRIQDTGIGMTPEQLERLFKPFAQADASTARNFGGTGLGLALSKRFCQIMGGRIDVDSEYGEGSTFTVWLPAKVGDQKAQSLHQLMESGAWAIASGHFNSSDLLAGQANFKPPVEDDGGNTQRRVLVIDDDLSVHELLEGVLIKEGYRVANAINGLQGLQLAREIQPDIITLDVYMPEKDGWEVLRELKADPKLASIPVIMISVSDERQKGYAMGADFLAKPIDRQELAAMLARYRGDGDKSLALVVDDDANLRDVLSHQLTQEGWAVQQAENGIAGLRRVAEQEPDVILLDLLMPQLDGFGFLAQLRKNPAWRNIPVIVLTAMDLGPEERQRLNGGVAQVLQKGAYDLDELKKEIRSLALRAAP